MASREQEKRQRRIADAGQWVTRTTIGDRMCLAMPQNLGMWRPKKIGAYRVSFIPFEVTDSCKRFRESNAGPGDWYFERTYHCHRGIGLNEDMVVCPRLTFAKPCPICEYMGKLGNSPKKEDVELLANLKPSHRQIFLILDHDDERAGVQLWDISFAMFGKYLRDKISMADERRREKYRRHFDFGKHGLVVRITCQEKPIGAKGKTNEYMVDEFQPREEEIPDNLYDHGYNLDDIVREIPYDQLKEMFLQTGGNDEGGSDEEGDDRGESRGVSRPAASGARNGTHRDGDDDKDDGGAWGRTTGTPGVRDREPERDKPDPGAGAGDYILGDPEPGDEVEWDKAGKVLTGVVDKVDKTREIAEIPEEGRDRPHVVDLDRLRIVRKGEPKKESPKPSRNDSAKPESRGTDRGLSPGAKPAGGRGWDDDEDDDRGGTKPEPGKRGVRR